MTDTELQRAVQAERRAARLHLDDLLLEWRQALWPNPQGDPIAHEDRRRRERALLAAETHWGVGLRPVYEGKWDVA